MAIIQQSQSLISWIHLEMTSSIDLLSMNAMRMTMRVDSTHPDLKHTLHNVVVNEQELQRIRDTIDSSELHNTTILSNFDARIGVLAPIFGYVSVLNENTMFNAHLYDRNLFRGIAIKEVTWGRHSIAKLEHRVNAIIGDKSPKPAQRGDGGKWICSLGANGWIGLYETNVTIKPKKYIIVVAGLDEQCYEQMRAEMRAMHRVKTTKDAFASLKYWRDVAWMNRQRLIATMCSILSIPVHYEDVLLVSRSIEKTITPELTEKAIKWLGDPPVRLPLWYRIPSRTPQGCEEIPEELCGYALGDALQEKAERRQITCDDLLDFVLDDVVYYRDDLLMRYSGAMPLSSHVVYMSGPVQSIHLYTLDQVVTQPETYNTVAVEAVGECQLSRPSFPEHLTVTWEEAHIQTNNRMAQSQYEALKPIPELQHMTCSVLEPVFVRISMMDHLGRVSTEINDKKRMTGFCGDAYDYINR